MYVFKQKDNRILFDTALLRTVLFAAVFLSIFFRQNNSYTSFITAAVLLVMALFTKVFLLKRFNKILLLAIAAVLLWFSTYSITLVVFFLIAGIVPGYLYKQPIIDISDAAIELKKMIGSTSFPWTDFSNIILKDNLLTLDFKNNKVLQLEVEEGSVVEKSFNDYCSKKIIH